MAAKGGKICSFGVQVLGFLLLHLTVLLMATFFTIPQLSLPNIFESQHHALFSNVRRFASIKHFRLLPHISRFERSRR